MTEFGKPITVHQFVQAFDPDNAAIHHIGNGRWVPRCSAGVLLIKNVAPYTCVEDALADLASVGIRRIDIEWDGLGESNRANEEPKLALVQ